MRAMLSCRLEVELRVVIHRILAGLCRLGQQRLIRSHGTGNKLTEKGLTRLAGLEQQAPKGEPAEEEYF